MSGIGNVVRQGVQQTTTVKPTNTNAPEAQTTVPSIIGGMSDSEEALRASEETAGILEKALNRIKSNNPNCPLKEGNITENGHKIRTYKSGDNEYTVVVRNGTEKVSETKLTVDDNGNIAIKQMITFVPETNEKLVTEYENGQPKTSVTYLKVGNKYVKKTKVDYQNGEPKTMARFNANTGKQTHTGNITKGPGGAFTCALTDIKTNLLTAELTVNPSGQQTSRAVYTYDPKDPKKRTARITQGGETVEYSQKLDNRGNVIEEIVLSGPDKGDKNTYEYKYDQTGKLISKKMAHYYSGDKKPSWYSQWDYNQKNPATGKKDAIVYREWDSADSIKDAEKSYIAFDSNGEEKQLDEKDYKNYVKYCAALDTALKNGMKLTPEQIASLKDSYINTAILITNKEILELHNRVMFGEKPNDTALEGKLKQIGDKYGVTIFTDYNVISEEYYNAHKSELKRKDYFVVSDDKLNQIEKALENMSKDNREALPKEIIFTAFFDANGGKFMPNNENAIYLRSHLLDKNSTASENHIEKVIYHETAHMCDYALNEEPNKHLSDETDIRVSSKKTFGTKKTGTISGSVARDYLGSYALKNNHEFVAEISAFIMLDIFVYDEQKGQYTINPDALTLDSDGEQFYQAGEITAWKGNKKDLEILNTIMNIYNSLLSDDKNNLHPTVTPKVLSNGEVRSVSQEEYLNLLKENGNFPYKAKANKS